MMTENWPLGVANKPSARAFDELDQHAASAGGMEKSDPPAPETLAGRGTGRLHPVGAATLQRRV